MLELFKDRTEEIYSIILQPIDSIFKLTAVEKYKKQFNIPLNSGIGDCYLNLIENHKENGTVYTPVKIADYIVSSTIMEEDVINNPFMKILDPSCGCGNLIIPCFKHMLAIYRKNLFSINIKNSLTLKEGDLTKHILDNNIYGFDLDDFALKILSIDLFYEAGYFNPGNFADVDFLLEDTCEKFHIIIGNPPYIGHKSIFKEYSLKLKTRFKNVFLDKGDMHYCFFYSALLNTVTGGKITFISSRYFLESPSGQNLRKILKENTVIEKILDFYGIRPFKNKGIDPVIISLKNELPNNEPIRIIKPRNNINNQSFFDNVVLNSNIDYDDFKIDRFQLEEDKWVLRVMEEYNIIKKIENSCSQKLSDICESYQGIISGCDKAFIVSNETIEAENLEKSIIRPWIKSSYIGKNVVDQRDNYIIYSDFIEDEKKYPKIMEHINVFRHKLETRRECMNGVRKWFQLQWGRKSGLFEGKKIIFPFKSDSNKFAIDKGSYFSADIYSLVIKDIVPATYEILTSLLNSRVYEFYFKTFGKKLGDKAYEYYPNYLMKMKIPDLGILMSGSDDELYKIFSFTEDEINIIERNFKTSE